MLKSPRLSGCLHFFRAGVINHLQTGAFFPSQRVLVEAMIAPVPRDYQGQILELGSGNGALTVRLAKRCPQARIVACELNPTLAEDTRQTLDRSGINGQVKVQAYSAQEVLADLTTRQRGATGYIISGLPLGNLRKQQVLELLRSAHKVLPKKGIFVQAQHFLWDRKHIRQVFGTVRTVPIVRNFPPVFVYYAEK